VIVAGRTEFSTPLALGSLRALIPAVIAALSPIVLTHMEDQTLQRELHRNILVVDDQPWRYMKCKHRGKLALHSGRSA
jgi:hypothetical protein